MTSEGSTMKDCTRVSVGIVGVVFVVSGRSSRAETSIAGSRHLFVVARNRGKLQSRAQPAQHE